MGNGDPEVKVSGLKTDVLLRTIGTLYYSNVQDMKVYWESIHESSLPKFAIQLFTILEDIRIQEKVKKSAQVQKNNLISAEHILNNILILNLLQTLREALLWMNYSYDLPGCAIGCTRSLFSKGEQVAN